MELKKGVAAIIFDESGRKRHFLLLHRSLNWIGWEFVKGGIEPGESLEQAVLREIEEETGLKEIKIIKKQDEKLQWKANKNYDYNVFLAKGNMKEKIELDKGKVSEHDNFEWVEQENVLNRLAHNENKEIFKIALEELV